MWLAARTAPRVAASSWSQRRGATACLIPLSLSLRREEIVACSLSFFPPFSDVCGVETFACAVRDHTSTIQGLLLFHAFFLHTHTRAYLGTIEPVNKHLMVLLHFEGSREYLEGSDLLLTLEAGVEALLTTYSTGTADDAPKDPVIFLAKFLKENNPRASAQGAQRMTEMRAAAATAAVRRRKLEAIFLACDDDGSGALSLNEFEQLFGRVDDSTRSQFGAILFAQADASKDGVLSLHEFVSFYYAKFVALDDEVFERVTDQLLELAKAAVVIDEEAAILDPASAAAEAAATTGGVADFAASTVPRARLFVSHAAWAPKRPFISYGDWGQRSSARA